MEDKRLIWTVRIIGLLLFAFAILFFPLIFTIFGYFGTLIWGGYAGLTFIILLLYALFRAIGEIMSYHPNYSPILNYILTSSEPKLSVKEFALVRWENFKKHLLDKRIRTWAFRCLGVLCFVAAIIAAPIFAYIASSMGNTDAYLVIIYVIFTLYLIALWAAFDLATYSPALSDSTTPARKFPTALRIVGWVAFLILLATILYATFIVQ